MVDDGPTQSWEGLIWPCGSQKPEMYHYAITSLPCSILFFSGTHGPDPVISPSSLCPILPGGNPQRDCGSFLGTESLVWLGSRVQSLEAPTHSPSSCQRPPGTSSMEKNLWPSQEEHLKRYLHSRSDGKIYKLLLHLLLSGKIHWAQNC